MKIGILTFHSSINPGSVLQAYCTQELLRSGFPNAKIEVINLIPYNRELRELNFFSLKPPFFVKSRLIKYFSIRRFLKQYINLSKKCYYRDINKQINFINRLDYDLIVTGSDTVWMYSGKLDRKLPSIYFLPKKIKSRKISMAASVDPLIEEIPYYQKKEELQKLFNDYELITVRDNTTYKLLDNLNVKHQYLLADPTILFPFEFSLKLPVRKEKITEIKNALIYITDKKVQKHIVNIINTNYPAISIYDNRNKDSHNIIMDMNNYHKYDLVITDRFHRSIFALKLSPALVINIERDSKNPNRNSKGRDLFEQIGISDWCLRYDSESKSNLEAEILSLINNFLFDPNNFHEAQFNAFKHKNQELWKRLITSLSIIN